MSGPLHEYDVEVNGTKTTLLLTEDDAKERGLASAKRKAKAPTEKAAAPAANKAAQPAANK